MKEYKQWFQENLSETKSKYFEFLQFASISADKTYAKHVLSCAQFLKEHLSHAGFHSELIDTKGYPIVYAEDLSAGPNAPTVLFYGHYDVQPVDPIDLWKSKPFEPQERDGKVFARGAVDNKGQIFYCITALIARKKLGKNFPVNIKLCIEGEEESHSCGLTEKLPSLKEKFKTDCLLIVDFDSGLDGSAYITLGARGCMGLEVSLRGSDTDLHSGLLGGLAYNPNRAMVELLAKIWDENGTVQVPHFYDDVVAASLEEKERFAFDLTTKELQRDFGIVALGNEKKCSLKEANWFRPTIEINGLFGGYSGSGSKTVIPATCGAKLTCRLVQNQDPKKIYDAIRKFLISNAPKGMHIDVIDQGGIGGYRSKSDVFVVSALESACKEVTGKDTKYVLSGASIPVGAEFVRVLQTQVIGMGYGLPTDEIHAPNEHFDMKRFELGFLTVVRIFDYL